MAIKHPTPLLDQLETGPWPSFVSDIKQEAEYRAANPDNVEFQVPADAPDDLLGVLELSYKEGETHWKHGGIVGVFGYGGGVIGRYCDQPEMFPGVAHFHTVRVAQPSGKYYSTEFLRGLCDIWELRGSGLTNMHGSTGDIVLIGTQTPQLEEIFYDLTHKLDVDLGGSGSNSVRLPPALARAAANTPATTRRTLAISSPWTIRTSCTVPPSPTSSSSSSTAARTAAWPLWPVPTLPSWVRGRTTSRSIRKL